MWGDRRVSQVNFQEKHTKKLRTYFGRLLLGMLSRGPEKLPFPKDQPRNGSTIYRIIAIGWVCGSCLSVSWKASVDPSVGMGRDGCKM